MAFAPSQSVAGASVTVTSASAFDGVTVSVQCRFLPALTRAARSSVPPVTSSTEIRFSSARARDAVEQSALFGWRHVDGLLQVVDTKVAQARQ